MKNKITPSIFQTSDLLFFIVMLLGLFLFSTSSVAQLVPPAKDETGLEDLYDRFEDQEVRLSQDVKKEQSQQQGTSADREAAPTRSQEVYKLSDLSTLAPIKDIAVIQRRFLPKTQRFELSGSAVLNTNNAFFNNVGAAARFAYYFTEKLGLEAQYVFLTSTERPVTENLKKEQNIATESLVEPESYYGLHLKWSPYYGKMAWLGQKIIPFDIYFTPGLGMTSTAFGSSHVTFNLGLGQIFALSKSAGLRWDLEWHMYQADTKPRGGKVESSQQNDLLFSIGYSFFFPEARYR